MNEIFYGLNSLLIAGFLLASMTVVIESGYQLGRSKQASADSAWARLLVPGDCISPHR